MKRLHRLSIRTRKPRRIKVRFSNWLKHFKTIVEVRSRSTPFFRTLHALLERQEETTLGDLAESAGEQVYGLLILLLALPSLVPGLNVGAAPIGGLALISLGLQMARGRSHPHLPARIRRQSLQKNRLKQALTRLEKYLEKLGSKTTARRALNQRWNGCVVMWTAFLLAIPVPLPFGNLLPGCALLLLGAALLEERPIWGWFGTGASAAITIYFAMSYKLIAYACVSVLRALWSGHFSCALIV